MFLWSVVSFKIRLNVCCKAGALPDYVNCVDSGSKTEGAVLIESAGVLWIAASQKRSKSRAVHQGVFYMGVKVVVSGGIVGPRKCLLVLKLLCQI